MADHPDPNILAAVVDGTLEPGQRESLEEHLAACPECRALVADVARQQPVRPGRMRRAYGWRVAAAAVVLAGLAAFVLSQGRSETPAERLADAVRSLSESDPDLFGDFRLLTKEERLAPSPVIQRGGPVLLHPTGKARSPVRFAWLPVTGATRYAVTLTTADGMPVWERTTDEPEVEAPLSPGRYLWSVTTQGAVKEEATRHVEVAGPEAIGALDKALQHIEASTAAGVRELLKAQYCTRLGFQRDAEHWARAAVEQMPKERLARETLHHVLNRIGSPEADRVLEELP